MLQISSAHRDDRGVYYCVAENGVGAEARANATVHVDFAPVIVAIRPRIGQAPGFDATLECRVEARPRPAVSWLRNGIALRQEYASPGAEADVYVDRYQRYSVGAGDYGEYVCRAENDYGFAQTKVELFGEFTGLYICLFCTGI